MFFEEAAEKCVAERSEFVPVSGQIVIRKLSEIDSAQPLKTIVTAHAKSPFVMRSTSSSVVVPSITRP